VKQIAVIAQSVTRQFAFISLLPTNTRNMHSAAEMTTLYKKPPQSFQLSVGKDLDNA
jgi:hypothetical protein